MAKKNFLGNSRNSSNGLRIVLNPLFEFRGGNRNYFGRYRSDYFIRIVFNNLKEKKVLNIIKYNKNIKNRININIGDYKKYSENYSSIEIEIKPLKNDYGRFINFKDEDIRYGTDLIVHGVDDLVPALTPAAGAHHPAFIFYDVSLGVPSGDVHPLFAFAGDIQQLHGLLEVNWFPLVHFLAFTFNLLAFTFN